MKLQVRSYLGMRPSRSADLLAPGEAQVAANVRLTAGELRPLNGLGSTLVTLTGDTVRSIYRFGQSVSSEVLYWFQSTGDVDYVKGPIDNDTVERTYFTDGSFPKKTDSTLATAGAPYPSASYAMGVPAPATAPSLSVSGTATDPDSDVETLVYVMTYVSSWGEEGPPSAASAAVSFQDGQTVNLTALAVAPGSGAHGENYNITGKRLYRLATGSQGGSYQLVNTSADIGIATTTYNDTLSTDDLGEVLETTGWLEPLYNMVGLRGGPNGIMAGFVGNSVCFSVPEAPYAWPVAYRYSTDAPIVAIEWFDQSLFVGTQQGIYIFTGADPSSMTSTKLPVAQSVVSKRSVVPMLGGVFFASPDGLMRIDASGIKNVTDEIMTRDDWQAYTPSSISAYESDNRYIAFYDNGTQAGMIFSFGAVPTFSTTSVYATAGFRDKKADALFLVTSGNTIKKFDVGSALTLTWTSGVFHIPSDECMACASVDASAYPVTFKLYADGALKHTETVANRYAFRLPSGYRSKRYYFTMEGTSIVRDVEIATSMAELTKS
jgi:hypothetical protein